MPYENISLLFIMLQIYGWALITGFDSLQTLVYSYREDLIPS
jgi:hypothetical protein